ncbi:hypothetical protein [Ureaplasma diversum]|uniref:Lipoprotein n=1 Tax=Ureaplasma diversum NCTC 246 TaxID=1188241 RepID=A0A084F134_9BACT|nr:hypothetical protein [Ureaplasma diversum]KEZ23926.1 hypothetical protein UDIV_1890 [Ureaplasma diversum NCTC 246]
MLNRWISIALTATISCTVLGIGIAFGFKNQKFTSSFLETKHRVFELDNKTYNKIKKFKKLHVKINNFSYYIRHQLVYENKNKSLIALDLKLDSKEKIVPVLIYTHSVPLIYDLINFL